MNNNLLHSMIASQINKGHATALKERLTRLMKMVYVLLTITPTYIDGLMQVYNKMKELKLKEDALGDLKIALDEMQEAGKHYDKAHEALMRLWNFSENKKEIDRFIMNTYNPLSDIIENACRCTPEGRFKEDFTYLAMIPKDEIQALNDWYKIRHKNDGKKIDVI